MNDKDTRVRAWANIIAAIIIGLTFYHLGYSRGELGAYKLLAYDIVEAQELAAEDGGEDKYAEFR